MPVRGNGDGVTFPVRSHGHVDGIALAMFPIRNIRDELRRDIVHVPIRTQVLVQ